LEHVQFGCCPDALLFEDGDGGFEGGIRSGRFDFFGYVVFRFPEKPSQRIFGMEDGKIQSCSFHEGFDLVVARYGDNFTAQCQTDNTPMKP